MAEHYCAHRGCIASEETGTLYKEPTDLNDRGWFPVCGEHADFSKDDVEVLFSNPPTEAELANSELLTTLQAQR